MNDPEMSTLEQELRRVRPAAPPSDFVARLAALRPTAAERAAPATPTWVAAWRTLVARWLLPGTALLTLGVLSWLSVSPGGGAFPRPDRAPQPLSADEVQIDQTLVSSFDAIARLPDGEPVRLRCRTWMDDVVLRDSARGIEVRQRAPRMEVVPVRFEVY